MNDHLPPVFRDILNATVVSPVAIDTALTELEKQVKRLMRERHYMLDSLHECLDYFEPRADVYDGDYGEQVPNEEAHLSSQLSRVIRMVEQK